jgi:CHAD domain-containing protein
MAVEQETKLQAPDDFRLPDLTGTHDSLVAAPAMTMDLDAVYYDSDDMTLARSGITLRHRTGTPGAVWTLKMPMRAGTESALVRRELDFTSHNGAVPPDARDLVRGYLRSRPLHRVGRLRTHRTSVPLLDDEGEQLLEVVDDVVSIFDGRQRTGGFHEVEIEVKARGKAARRALEATVHTLVDAGCQKDRAVPKLVRAVGARATAPAELETPELGADPNVRRLVKCALQASAGRLVQLDPGVRLGEDPEDLHRFRVAARRLRSDLRTFGPVLDPTWNRELRGELAWLGTEVGTVRDLDVLRERITASGAAALGPSDALGLALVMTRIEDQHEAARARVLRALRSRRYDRLLDSLVEAVHNPVYVDPRRDPDRAARKFVRQCVRRQWRQLDRAVRALDDVPDDAELHQVRIRAKRCRYAAEAAAPLLGDDARKLAGRMTGLQDELGTLCDTNFAEGWLLRAAGADADCAIAAGKLIAVERFERSLVHQTWRPVWRKARRTAHAIGL